VAFSPDGRRVLSGTFEGTLRIWDVETARELRQWKEASGCVRGVAFSPDGKLFLSAGGAVRDGDRGVGGDFALRLCGPESGPRLPRFGAPRAPVASAVSSPDGRRILAGSFDKTVRIWDVNGSETAYFQEPTAAVNSVAISPDGRSFLSGGNDHK